MSGLRGNYELHWLLQCFPLSPQSPRSFCQMSMLGVVLRDDKWWHILGCHTTQVYFSFTSFSLSKTIRVELRAQSKWKRGIWVYLWSSLFIESRISSTVGQAILFLNVLWSFEWKQSVIQAMLSKFWAVLWPSVQR